MAFSSSSSGWCSLPGLIIDKVVAIVKETGRWTRDGPSLRSLNVYWYHQLNLNVVAISPHTSRAIAVTDAFNLIKFCNATFVDARPFLENTAPVHVVQVLGSLSRLFRLEIGDPTCVKHLPDEALNRLSRVTSLGLGYEGLRAYGETLWKFASLPLEELRLNGAFGNLGDCLPEFPSLKRLEIAQQLVDLSFLRFRFPELESLTINCHPAWFNDLVALTTLVDLRIVMFTEDVEWMLELRQLKHLAVSLRPGSHELLKSEAFGSVLKNLESLDLENEYRACPFYLADELPQLKKLALRKFIFPASYLEDFLSNLTSLKLRCCTIRDGSVCFFNSLKHIEKLYLLGLYTPNYHRRIHLPLDPWLMPKLRTLVLSVEDRICPLRSIEHFTNLETLCLSSTDKWTLLPEDRCQLEKMCAIRKLAIENAAFIRDGASFLLDFLSRLEILCVNDALADNCEFVEAIKDKVPQLKLITSDPQFDSFVFNCV